MSKPSKQQLLLALCCFVCIVIGCCATLGLEGEFTGGWLTGPLFWANDIGTDLFAFAFIVAFLYPRIAGAISLASSALCLPLFLYLVAPVPFSHLFAFGHPFSVRPSDGIHWGTWPIAGALAIAANVYVCIRSFTSARRSPQ